MCTTPKPGGAPPAPAPAPAPVAPAAPVARKSEEKPEEKKDDSSSAAVTAWEWHEHGKWTPYCAEICKALEAAKKSGQRFVALDKGPYFGKRQGDYTVDLQKMDQLNLKTGYARTIRRVLAASSANVSSAPVPAAFGSGLFGAASGFVGGMGSMFGFGGGPANPPAAKAAKSASFVDPNEILKKEEKEREEDEKLCKDLASWYTQIHVPLSQDKLPPKIDLMEILEKLHGKLDYQIESKPEKFDECQVCFAEEPITLSCGCAAACKGCTGMHAKTKIEAKEVNPWIYCPAEKCNAPLTPKELSSVDNLTTKLLAQFADEYLKKLLARSSAWIPCKKENCDGGFFVPGKPDKIKDQKLTCFTCKLRQKVSKKVSADEGLKDLFSSGALRPCPKCKWPQMKDKGLCNIMNCGKCGIWWNWRTKETGNAMRELKNRARNNGSLWEPGELDYQRRLERRDPAAFKLLLERNGMKYDPNYVRGRS